MSDPERTPPPAPEIDVALVMRRLREGVRQRLAEAATVEAGGAGGEGRLLALRESAGVREPVPHSARPGLGRWVVAARKGVYHLFLKWLVRPLVAQQNLYNEASAQWIEELVAGQERLRREVARQGAEIERLREEARGERLAAPVPTEENPENTP